MPIAPASSATAPLLVVVPIVGMAIDGDRAFLDIKATDGLGLFTRHWPGPVRCLCREADPATIGYGRWYERAALPFEVRMLPPLAAAPEIAPHAVDAALVLAGADNHLDLGLVEALPGVPVVLTIEYTLRTQLDIIWLGHAALHRKLRTSLWLLRTDIKRRRALRTAAGIQANGTPAFDAYGPASPAPLLYFDTRLPVADFIGGDGAEAKAVALAERAPLRLAFSGRLEPLKGADDLVRVIEAVRRRGKARVVLDIFGKGSRRAPIAAAIARAGLGDMVRLRDPVDFNDELVPLMKRDIDLFLCCHRQGDPSCTYLETLGCGVPILGYENSAFRGVLALGHGAVGVPLGDVEAMAAAIERLDADRGALADLTRGAAEVAAPRLFETVFAARTAHLREVAGLAPAA